MKDIQWQILDIYDEENLVDGVIQSLPAYLKVTFNIKANYTIKAYSPEGITSGETEGISYHGLADLWRIPFFEQSGEWKITIYLHDKDINDSTITLVMEIPQSLFQDLSELEAEIESSRNQISIVCDDWLESFTKDIHEISLSKEIKREPLGSLVKEIKNSTEVMDDWMQTFDQSDKDTSEKELDANWLHLNSELKIWQYHNQDLNNQISEEFSIPILLVHGWNADHTTWNNLALYLWEGGIRNIFAMDLLADFYGLDKNCQYLDNVIREVEKFTKKESFYIISHSFGGLVSRQFVKEYDNKGIRLLVTMGSPHYGIAKIFSRIFGTLKKRQLKKDGVDREKLPFPTLEAYLNNLDEKLNALQLTFNDSDLYLLTMVNICGDKIYGGDGLFKAIEVPDMINYTINASHLSINKSKATYNLIKGLMTGDSIVYKITLIQVNTIVKSPSDLQFYFLIKPKTNLNYQRYPFEEYLQTENEEFTCRLPKIIFSSCKKEAQNELLDIQILNNEHKKIAQKELFIGLGYKKEAGDLFEVESTEGYSFQFAVYSYRLHYKTKVVE